MGKLTVQIKKLRGFFARQLREHKLRSAVIAAVSAAVVTVGVLFLCGVFTPTQWSYLPNRAYILAPTVPEEPQTLHELLHSDTPDVETFLKTPSIAQELLDAEEWTDIADSRFALNNLREIERQLEERLAESLEYSDFAELIPPESGLLAQAQGAEQISSLGSLPTVSLAAGAQYATVTEKIQNQYVLLDSLKTAAARLIAPMLRGDEELKELEPAINIKGVWEDSGEVLIHMTPEGDWLPENGYTLTRTVGGETTVIAEKAAAQSSLFNKVSLKNADMVKELYAQAQLTTDKLAKLGVSAEDFRKTVYRVDSLNPKTMIDGALDFKKMGELQITVCGDISQKLPETDRLLASPVLVMEQRPNGAFLKSAISTALLSKFSFKPSTQAAGIDRFGKSGEIRYNLAQEVLVARQQIATMSYVDSEFAEEAEFLLRDDLSALDLSDGTEVTYTISANGVENKLTVVYGRETDLSAPRSLAGYGYDGVVSLRWADLSLDKTADPIEKGIVSGYHIERRLDGEGEFKQITVEPVVIGYVLDELAWLQSPVYFQNELENGRTAEYRVRSIDIFGRTSGFSEPITVKVEKITPPNAPTAGTGVKSDDVDTAKALVQGSANYGLNTAVQNSVKLNSGTEGVVLPIFTDSPETARFTVYRAVAVGRGNFGTPEPIADLLYDNPKKDVGMEAAVDAPVELQMAQINRVSLNGAKQFLLKEEAPNWPDLVYFDAEIEPGCTYKYWVSAWDDPAWNNESAWSQSVTVAIPTEKEPDSPTALNIAMLARGLPDRSQYLPGLVNDSGATFAEMKNLSNDAEVRLPNPDPSSEAAQNTKIDGETMKLADDLGVSVGSFSKERIQPTLISVLFGNLPGDKYIHTFATVKGGGVLADGTVRLRWPAYSGEGLEGYNVYQAMFDPPPVEEMRQMTKDELIQLGYWQKMTKDPITQNQFTVGNLVVDSEKPYVFLVCIQPTEEAEAAAQQEDPIVLTEPKKPVQPVPPKLYDIEVDAPGSVTVNLAGIVTVKTDSGLTWTFPTGYSFSEYGEEYILKSIGSAESYIRNISPSYELLAVLQPYYNAYSTAFYAYKKALEAHPVAVEKYEEDMAEYEAWLISGYVNLEWDIPADPQVQYYRVYRAEVRSFKKPINEALLEWTMLGDRLSKPQFYDLVDQSHAYYYYYKVTAVSPWGVESAVGVVKRFRVPATLPPATPNLLVPLQRKDGVQVNFSAVQYCDRYVVYRTEIPKISDAYLAGLNKEVKSALFGSVIENDAFLSTVIKNSVNLQVSTNPNRTLNAISRFNTMNYASEDTKAAINNVSADNRMNTFNKIMDDLGPLVLSDYRDLSVAMMKKVEWAVVGELPADFDTVEEVLDPETGLPGMLKPLSIIDETAEYGKMYLYTVQAWNDDNLGSTRPEPVEATPRRSGPFDPIMGVKADESTTQPSLSWNTPTMKNLNMQQCLDETVGYIVYRSDTEDGEYYQASPMVFEPKWVDKEADPYAFNWYRVKVLDTGGYLSEFSAPILVRKTFNFRIMPYIPVMIVDPEAEPPVVSVPGGPHTVIQGEKLVVPFAVTGDEPINYKIEGSARGGAAIVGMTADGTARTITIPSTLAVGIYGATLTAENEAGASRASFSFEVTSSAVAPKIDFGGSRFSTQQGAELRLPYTLTGTEPIAVTVVAKNSAAAAAYGFFTSTDASGGNRHLGEPGNLAADTYNVVVTAKNSAGESTATFTLVVSSSRTAPVIAPEKHGYSFETAAGQTMNVAVSATGSVPITWSLEASGKMTLPPFVSINASTGELTVSSRAQAGYYYFIIRAANDVGFDTRECALNVVENRTAPKINRAAISAEMTRGTDFTAQFSATGSTPLVWTLEPANLLANVATVPAEISIDSNGLLNVKGEIAAGEHRFIIRVTNDVGSDTLEYTLTVKLLRLPIRRSSFHSGTGAGVTLLADVKPATQTEKQADSIQLKEFGNMLVRVGNSYFKLTDVKLSQQYEENASYYGTAMLDMVTYGIPVEIARASWGSNGSGLYTDVPNQMTAGIIYVAEAFEIPGLGVTIASLNISPQSEQAVVSGYAKNPVEGRNLAGDLYAFEFIDAELKPLLIIVRNNLPDIRYKQFTIHGSTEFLIQIAGELTSVRGNPEASGIPIPFGENEDFTLLSASGCKVSMKSHLETLNNEGLEFVPRYGTVVGFDLRGEMTAALTTEPGDTQAIQLLVPGGAMLRVVSASVAYRHGEALPNEGAINGRLILPFERDDVYTTDVTAAYAKPHSDTNEMDTLMAGGILGSLGSDVVLNTMLNYNLYHFGQTVQQNSLLVVPNDTQLQDQCAYVYINIGTWDGEGFTLRQADMTPARVTNRNLGVDLQRTQAIVVSPTKVSVDLDRRSFVSPFDNWNKQEPNEYETAETMLPKETQQDFWVGLIMHGGKVALPDSFIKPKDHNVKAITFDLAEGEMIYDLNGFNYQTYMYNNDGVPAEFGSALGGFEDVWVYDVLLDMYANRVNLEINVEVMLEHLNYNRVKAKLYTNKEDNADGKAGEFLCALAPTELYSVFGTGIDMVVDGGFFREGGLHMNGSLVIATDEVRTLDEPLAFTDMLIPPKMEMSNSANDSPRRFCNVQLDKPVNVIFQGFSMEVRQLNMECMLPELKFVKERVNILQDIPLRLTLSGSTQLSENIPLGQETTDKVILERYIFMIAPEEGNAHYESYLASLIPKVIYDESRSVLKANFDGCVEVTGTLVPKLTEAGTISAQMSAGGTGSQVVLLSSGGLPDLPKSPGVPDPNQYLNEAKGTAQEQVKAYKQALEAEIAKYQEEIERQIGGMENMAQSQIDQYKQKAKDALNEYLNGAMNNLTDELEKYKTMLTDELSKFIDLGMLGEGLVEFNADDLGLNFLDQLQNLKVDTEVRIGYDMRNQRCYFAVGLLPVNADSEINFGAGNVKDFTGIVTYNMVVGRDEKNHYKFPTQASQMAAYIENLPVHRDTGTKFAAAIKGTLIISGFAEVRNMYFGFESGPAVVASGELYVPLSVKSMVSGSPEKRIGEVSIIYSHPERYFSFSITLDKIDVAIAAVSGSLGFEFSPRLFGVYIGYPETLAGNFSIFRVGVGVGFRIDDKEMLIKAKLEIGFEKSVTVAIVYLDGYLYAGADGAMYFNVENNFEPSGFSLELYLKGGIKGGIVVSGKKFNIISLYLDARGKLSMIPPSEHWKLECSATVGYSLNLFLFSVSGSVSASFDTTIK